jgi:aminobenzoyl-glutamate transport protein
MKNSNRDGGNDQSGFLNLIERIGNALPDPNALFLIGAVLVMILSALAVALDWQVIERLPRPVMVDVVLDDGTIESHPQLDENGEPVVEWVETGVTHRAESLLTREGFFWCVRTMVDNFRNFPPLGIVLVGMLGIGVAERTGLIAALLRGFMLFVPGRLLTPAMVFVGVMSSLATDAGYVVLPPLAAALYKAAGRSPLTGIAAVFAGVAAGFNANLLVTSLDPLLTSLTEPAARIIDPNHVVNPTCNWWFMAASTFVVTFAGWAVTSWFVEKRLNRRSVEDGGPAPATAEDLEGQLLTAGDVRGMKFAGIALFVTLAVALALILIPGAPLSTYTMPHPTNPERTLTAEVWIAPAQDAPPPEGAYTNDEGIVLVRSDNQVPRWARSIVPLLMIGFVVPGIAFGLATRTISSAKDVAKLMIDTMAAMAPIIVLAFFAGQFIAYFEHSNLGRMLAMAGGQLLGQASMPNSLLIVVFIAVAMMFNLIMASMSAKWTLFAPIFVPMFMMVGISPELTQGAYRIGDSVTNIITPLNAYLVIILVYMQKYAPRAGMGTLISTMLPYSVVLAIVWTAFLLLWMALGIPLGPGGTLTYVPAG